MAPGRGKGNGGRGGGQVTPGHQSFLLVAPDGGGMNQLLSLSAAFGARGPWTSNGVCPADHEARPLCRAVLTGVAKGVKAQGSLHPSPCTPPTPPPCATAAWTSTAGT